MNLNQFTQKSLEAVQSARDVAVQNGHQQLEQVHLLLALLKQESGLVPQLLRKIEITVESMEAAANTELRRRTSDKTEKIVTLVASPEEAMEYANTRGRSFGAAASKLPCCTVCSTRLRMVCSRFSSRMG